MLCLRQNALDYPRIESYILSRFAAANLFQTLAKMLSVSGVDESNLSLRRLVITPVVVRSSTSTLRAGKF